MDIEKCQVTTTAQVDEMMALAKREQKTFWQIEQWAARCIPDPQLYKYCVDEADKVLQR